MMLCSAQFLCRWRGVCSQHFLLNTGWEISLHAISLVCLFSFFTQISGRFSFCPHQLTLIPPTLISLLACSLVGIRSVSERVCNYRWGVTSTQRFVLPWPVIYTGGHSVHTLHSEVCNLNSPWLGLLENSKHVHKSGALYLGRQPQVNILKKSWRQWKIK